MHRICSSPGRPCISLLKRENFRCPMSGDQPQILEQFCGQAIVSNKKVPALGHCIESCLQVSSYISRIEKAFTLVHLSYPMFHSGTVAPEARLHMTCQRNRSIDEDSGCISRYILLERSNDAGALFSLFGI